jgi:hypothetical protein
MLSHQRGDTGSYTALQQHFLGRLNRLLKLRSDQSVQLNEEGQRLIDRTIYSIYCDAVDLGATEEAQAMLHRYAVPGRKAKR